MSTPNNRRRDPGGLTGEAILVWVGIVAVGVLVASVYGSVRLGHAIAGDGAELPSDPFALVFGVFSGKVSWPAASWWVLGGILAFVVEHQHPAAVAIGAVVHSAQVDHLIETQAGTVAQRARRGLPCLPPDGDDHLITDDFRPDQRIGKRGFQGSDESGIVGHACQPILRWCCCGGSCSGAG